MPGFKSNLKNATLRAVRSTGAYAWAAKSKGRRDKLLILCYHGLSLRDEHEWAGHLFISAEQFRQRVAALRRMNASILPLGEAISHLRAGTLPPQSVAITFDDGFYDFLHHGVPILQEFQVPCTLYLTTYYSDNQFPIINLMLSYLLWKSNKSAVALPEFGIADEMPIRDWNEQMAVVRQILSWLEHKQATSAEKDAAARQLATHFGIDYDDLLQSRLLQIVTPDEAAIVARAGVDIQLHTHRHRTPDDRGLFTREIQDNRKRIEAITGKQPVHFCYPSGRYSAEFLPWLRECGVQSATTCERGFARAESDPMLLPRLLDDSNMDLVQFEAYVAGVLSS